MSSANLMGLVRELKALNARKKAGQALSDEENKRRKQLKAYLKSALEKEKGEGTGEFTNPASLGSASGVASSGGSMHSGSGAPITSGSGPAVRSPAPAPVAAAPAAVVAPTPAPVVAPSIPPPAAAAARNAFAIDASGLFAEAEQSKAVDATHRMESGPGAGGRSTGAGGRAAPSQAGWTGESGAFDLDKPLAGFTNKKASKADIDLMVAKADQAVRATKTRERAQAPEQVAIQLDEIVKDSGFTDREDNYVYDDYFSDYEEEGYEFLEDDRAADLKPIDPRELELYKAGLGGTSTGSPQGGEGTAAAPPEGLAFLDDFPELYARGVLPSPLDEEEPDLDDPNLLIPGRRKVTVHMLNGSTKRGAIRKLSRTDLGFTLDPLGAGRSEDIPLSHVKAVFIMKRGRADAPAPQGHLITVTFRDRRKVQGVTTDYAPGVPLFTLIPQQQGQFERIIVNSQAVVGVQ